MDVFQILTVVFSFGAILGVLIFLDDKETTSFLAVMAGSSMLVDGAVSWFPSLLPNARLFSALAIGVLTAVGFTASVRRRDRWGR